MQRLIAIFAILLVGCVYAQNVGGTTGPCSAVAIPTPYTKPITVYGSNVGAQSYSGGCVSSSSGVVWYTISPPTGVNITLTTCNAGTTFDTVISVYTQTFNNSCSSLTCFAFNDDTSCSLGSGRSSISFASSGLTYYVGVGGYSSSSGTFQLTLTQTNTSSGGSNNPGCGNATRINGPYNPAITVFGSNVGGITGYNEIVNTTCQINLYQFSSWYQIFPVTGQYVNVTTCNAATNFDTILTVVSGNQCSSLNCTARNDDSCFYYNSTSSSVDFYATAESYYVIVSGYSSFTGNFELTIFQGGSSGNGNGTGGGNGTSSATCSNAQVIYPSNSYYGSTAGIPASGFVDACSRYSNRPAVWFQLQNLFSNSSVTLSTCNSYTNFDTVILVYGGSCSSLSCVAYNDDSSCSTGISTSSTLVFYPTTSSYYVVVAAYGSVTGNFLLTVS